MAAGDRGWTFVTESVHAHEQRAIQFLEGHLPDHEPFTGWSNFEFTSFDGACNEVDALVLAKCGCFLVEIKSHPGRLIRADQQTLHIRTPDDRTISINHPIRLANLKAKRLRELLKREAGAKSREIPFIEPLCFLAEIDGFDPDIPAHLLAGLVVRDEDRRGSSEASDEMLHRPGVMRAILERGVAGLSPEPPRIDRAPGYIDKPRRKLITKCMRQIGYRVLPGERLIGDWRVVETIDEAEYFRDVEVVHAHRSGTTRRGRIYFAADTPEASLTTEQINSAAEREAALLERLRHEGILAYRDHLQSPEGPVLLFESTAGFQTLESWCRAASRTDRPEHGVGVRLDLLRSIAEAVAYAHGQHVVHRGLSPSGILVKREGDRLEIRIMNWQAGGVAAERATTQVVGTLHPAEYQAGTAEVYAAPELANVGGAMEPTLDVFSLGAIAYRLFADEPPAENRDALNRIVREFKGLDLPSAPGEVERELKDLVRTATSPLAEHRYETVRGFLDAVDAIEGRLNSDAADCESIEDASEGSRLSDDLRVVKRLGKGSTAFGFLVERIGAGELTERFILKIATDSDHNGRIDAEADAIARLSHDHIIRVEGGTFDLFGRRAFLGRPTGDQTLRDRLAKDGPLELELLERFGSELLSALSHLESRDVPHRDLKPENIAIVGGDSRKARRLVLFDFSLAAASPENIQVGTAAYLDPFLPERPRRRWDSAADRYSAALVLHEMATGALPVWGDGRVLPIHATSEITLNGESFAAGVRERMLRFFRKALARTPRDRHADAEAMALDWREIFRDTRHAPTIDRPESLETVLDTVLQLQAADTPMSDIPLSTRASNVLDREGVFTVRDLLTRPSNWLLSARGVGQKTRSELNDLVRSLRRRFPEVIIDPAAAGRSGRTGPDKSPAPDVAGGPTSADPERLDLAQTLEHLFTALTNSEREVAKALLGLADIGGVPAALLPTGSDVARSLGKTRQRIQQVQTSIRRKWANSPITDSLQDDLAIRLDRNQGLLVVDEVSRSLAVEREPGRIDAPRDSMARALVGIAADLEAQKGDPRYRLRRRENRQFVVASDELLRYALDLGRRADQLVAQDPLPDPPSVRDTLVETTRPAAVAAIPPDRLARLAAAGSSKAAVSARGELYPVGLSIERTVRLAGATLGRLGTSDSTSPNERRIARSDILDQLRRRYPEADLPDDGKSVAGALAANGWQGITYDGTRDDLVTRLPDAVSLASPESRITLSTRSGDRGERPRPAHADEISSAREFEESLRDAFTQKRFQALVVAPHHHRNAVAAIAACCRDLGVEVVDLDELITTAIDDIIEKQLPNPEVFYTAEAIGPEGRHWRNVLDLAHRAIDGVIETLREGDTPVLLVHAGLVGRFDRPDLFETFNQTLTGRESPRGVVLLIVGDDAADAPLLDGWAIPCLGEQFRPVPKAFLRAAAPSAAG